jgi:NAD-dependent deacetylase sirtuin 4
MGRLGVKVEDRMEFYNSQQEADWLTSSGQPRQLAVVTQNVDTLHRRAGSKHIVELHGRIDEVICMQCRTLRDRLDFHHELEHLNHDWLQEVLAERRDGDLRPDGDANLERTNYDEVIVPPCRNCGGFVKPNVVFFGDNVPLDRVELCKAAVDQADGILVVGTSLAVHSAYRHVRAALQKGIPVAILNVGETRVERDGERVLKIEAPAGSTLALCSTHFAKNNGEKLGTTNNVASL